MDKKELEHLKKMVKNTTILRADIKHWLVKYSNINPTRTSNELYESITLVKEHLEMEINERYYEQV